MQPDDPRSEEDRIGQIWDAWLGHNLLDLGRDDLDPSITETIRRLHAADDIPAPAPGLATRIWEDLVTGAGMLPGPLPAASVTPSTNGHAPRQALSWPVATNRIHHTRVARRRAVAATVRGAGIGAIAGMGAGLIAIGLGARLAMRATALTAGDAAQGRLTDNGERLGLITLDGTLFLLGSGALLGIVGGILYAAVRPWLPWSGWRRGLVFGLLLWATFAGAVMQDGTNPDYHRFGYVGLNIALFCALPVVFGLIAAPLADWLDRRVARWPERRRPTARDYGRLLGLAGPALFGLLAVVMAVGAGVPDFGEARPFDWLASGRFQVVLVALVARAAVTRTAGRFDRPAELLRHRRAAYISYGALALPVLAGLVLTIRAIERVLAAAG